MWIYYICWVCSGVQILRAHTRDHGIYFGALLPLLGDGSAPSLQPPCSCRGLKGYIKQYIVHFRPHKTCSIRSIVYEINGPESHGFWNAFLALEPM